MSAVLPPLKAPGAIDPQARLAMHRKRKMVNVIALTLAMTAMVFGLVWLVWILFTTLKLGVTGMSWTLFTESTPDPTSTGGLANAIVGSLMMVTLATLVGTPLGILAGVYLGEYGDNRWVARATRFINDILLAAPSIVIGLFIYAMVVARSHRFSGYAGVLALALLVIPVVVRTTENMLRLVPNALREAAFALGTPKWKVIYSITIKASRAGVITGVLLAVARISGETAPLLFTSLSNQFMSFDLSGPTANLPVTIFKFAMSGYDNLITLAWAGVFLITLGVLAINVLARMLFRKEDL